MIKKSILQLVILSAIIIYLTACTVQETKRVRKTCLDCHAELVDKFTAGVVHEPLKSGRCEDCHRPHGLVGAVYLNAPAPELCFKCHEKLAQALNSYPPANLHEPVASGKCGTCHNPHNAPFPHLLNKESEQTCYQCHPAKNFARKFHHQPLSEGCQICHQAHGGQFPGLLPVSQSQLCQRCHKFEDNQFINRHGGYPVTTACLECHDVHSSDNAKLLKPVLHQPVASRDCGDCHLDVKSKAPFSLKSEGSNLCRDCHDIEAMANQEAGAHLPVKGGDCLECHSPHASNFRE